MSKRDRKSEDDIRKLLPDVATILRHADPAYSEKMLQEAMDNPELDAALEDRKRGLDALDREAQASADTATEGTVRVSAPSPWAHENAGGGIDKSALPSAAAPKVEVPAAAPPVTAPIRSAAMAERGGDGRRALPRWILPAIAAIALSPFMMWAVVSSLPPRHPQNPGSSAQATASAAPAPSAAPSADRSADPTPSAAPTTSAVAPPAVPGTQTVDAPLPAPQKTGVSIPHKARSGDPYDAAAPSAAKTAAPIVTVTPKAPEAAPPPPASSGSKGPTIFRPRDD